MEDNARKFIVDSLDPEFLKENNAISFVAVVDWLETNEENEKKLAYKKFENGDIQILLVSKITTNGNRVADRKKISEEEYEELLKSSVLRLEKKRYEFNIIQNNITFSLKYDEIEGGKLYMLEVDAANEKERSLFDPVDFPAKLSEVTGDMRYFGYRVVKMV